MNQKSYSWNSGDYARHSAAQYRWAEEMIGKLQLQGEEAVIDIGCGDGKVTAMIASHLKGGSVTGIDSATGMIALALKNYPSVEYPNLSFAMRDVTALDFDNRFDVAFSNATLHWVKDQPSALRGIRRALKRPGRILFQMGGKGNAQDIIETVTELMGTEKWRAYFDGFSFPYVFCSPSEYEQWLIDAGLSPVRAELIPKDMTQEGRGGLAGWIRTTWLPYTERIPESERARFIGDIIDLYSEKFPIDAGGLFHVKMVRLEVEAVNP